MADEEQLDEILRRGPKEWNAWREANPETPLLLYRANLVEADLKGAHLSNANLERADLTGANLDFTDLQRTNLANAELQGAHLRHADLRGANLQVADLARVHLEWCDFSDADLEGADLDGATVQFVSFSRAKLTGTILNRAHLFDVDFVGANLAGAVAVGTIFEEVNFAGADGLAEVDHLGGALVATSCLDSTAAGLSYNQTYQGPVETFLRAAGLEEHWIDYFRSRIGQPIEFYSCFISYSHVPADRRFAQRLYADLQARGIRCWLDEHELLPGHDIYDRVEQAIRIQDKVLLCCSEDSLRSWWVENEITTTFEKEQQRRKETGEKVLSLIPLDLDRYLFEEWDSGLAAQVRRRLAADFTGWEADNAKYETELEKVVEALRTQGI